jgi:SulP family sulfate permease
VMALELLRLLPSFLAVAFVGTLTVLLSLSSLELTYHDDFQLEPALRLHGRMTLLTAALGGYLCLISIGRSTMSHQTGGGRWSCLVIAGACLAVLFGFGGLMAWIPKVALGALVLWLGLDLLRQWLWNLRKELNRIDLAQVVSILACVIVFGYVIGFLAGLLAACIFFVVNYSHMPYIRLDTTLAVARSSVIRSNSWAKPAPPAALAASRVSSSSAWPTRSTSGTVPLRQSGFRCCCWTFRMPGASTSRRWRCCKKSSATRPPATST